MGARDSSVVDTQDRRSAQKRFHYGREDRRDVSVIGMGDKSAYRNLGELVRSHLVTFAVRAMNGVGYKNFGEPTGFEVETVHLKLNGLPQVFSGLRIAQISDIHMGGWITPDRLQQVANLVADAKPVILAITGDL